MKQIRSEKEVKFLFNELLKDGDGSGTGIRLLAQLLKSETTPFAHFYVTKTCKLFKITTFLNFFKKNFGTDRNEELKFLMSADCLAASRIDFIPFENRIVSFLPELPIFSQNFTSIQWSVSAFFSFLRTAASIETTYRIRPDWNAWCNNAAIDSEYLNEELWNANDQLWRFLNYKCLLKMTKLKRTFIVTRYLAIFKYFNETPKQSLMKLVSLGASLRLLMSLGADYFSEICVIKTYMKEILNQLLSNFNSKRNSLNIPLVAARLIRYCGINPDVLSLASSSSSRSLFMNIYKLIKNESFVNSSWLLNLIYLAVLCPRNVIIPMCLTRLVDWFFTLNPSVVDTCQLLEILLIRKDQHLIKTYFLQNFEFNSVFVSNVYQQCPGLSNSLEVPLKTRVKVLLLRRRTFPNEPLSLILTRDSRNNFLFLMQFIIEIGNSIFNHNCAVFNANSTFKSLDYFFEHFLRTFLLERMFYDQVGIDSDNRPIIVPNLKCPKRVLRIIFTILARSVVLSFKVPFSIPVKLFCAALSTDGSLLRHSSLGRVKLMFFNNFFIENDYDLIKIESANKNENNLKYLFESLHSYTNKRSVFTNRRRVDEIIVLKLIKSLLEGIHSGIHETFSKEISFTCTEIYNLIFNRNKKV